MGVSVAVTRVAAPTSTGNQDITTTDLGGLTPKAVFLIATRAVTDGVAADGAGWYMGASDGTNNWTSSREDEHGVATMDVRTDQSFATAILVIYDGTADGVVEATADFVSFISDGVRINWTDAPASAFLVTAIFFAGSDLTAHVATQNLGNTADALIDITSIGFEADAVITAYLRQTDPDGALGMGFIHNDRAGTVTQRSIAQNSRNFSSSQIMSIVRNDCIVKLLVTGALDWFGTAQSFDSSGFSVQLGNARSPANAAIGWIALRFGATPAVDAKVYTLSTPTATGNSTDAGAGFEPQAVFYLPTLCAAVDTIETDADAGSVGLAAIDADEAYCMTNTSQDAAADANTQSLSDDQAVNLPLHDGAAGMAATFVAFTASGVTLNWSDVEAAARLYPALAIEAEAAGGGDLSVSASESATIADAVSLDALVIPDLAQSEAVTLAENVKAELEIAVQSGEAISVADSASVALSDPQISAADSSAVVDTASLDPVTEINISASESITVGDFLRHYQDLILVSDVASVDLAIEISQSDAVTVADDVSVTIVVTGDLLIIASDTVSVADAGALDALLLDVAASDAVTTTDTAGIDLPVGIAESEAVTIADAVSVDPLLINALLSEAVTVVDSPIVVRQVEGELTIVVSDAVAVADSPALANELAGINIAVDNFDYWVVGVKVS